MKDDKSKFTPPFIKVPTVIADTTQLTEGHVALYVALKAHQNAKTGQCNPSNETLAKHLGISPRTVKRRKTDLIKRGILNIQRGYQSSVQYSFPLETGKPGQVLNLMKDLKRKEGASLLGDWIEKTEDSYGPPVAHEQEERTTHGQAAPIHGGGGGGRGGEPKREKKEKPKEPTIEEIRKRHRESQARAEALKEEKRLEREAKREAHKAEIEKIMTDYRARKAREEKKE